MQALQQEHAAKEAALRRAMAAEHLAHHLTAQLDSASAESDALAAQLQAAQDAGVAPPAGAACGFSPSSPSPQRFNTPQGLGHPDEAEGWMKPARGTGGGAVECAALRRNLATAEAAALQLAEEVGGLTIERDDAANQLHRVTQELIAERRNLLAAGIPHPPSHILNISPQAGSGMSEHSEKGKPATQPAVAHGVERRLEALLAAVAAEHARPAVEVTGLYAENERLLTSLEEGLDDCEDQDSLKLTDYEVRNSTAYTCSKHSSRICVKQEQGDYCGYIRVPSWTY